MKHKIVKSRLYVVRRLLTVKDKQYLTPRMLRIVFRSEQLQGFTSPSPDDHIKVFFPAPPGEEQAKRDFTPRAWDLAEGTMTLDFALHEQGPAANWARAAQPGSTLEIGGPRGSTIVPDDFDWYLMIGDACALPSFSRRLEELRATAPAYLFALVADQSEQQGLPARAIDRVTWLTCGNEPARDIAALRAHLDASELPEGDGYIWLAGESALVRHLYQYFVEERQHNTDWIKAAAYWARA